jgi:amidohydrolase
VELAELLTEDVVRRTDRMVDIRRALHVHPELSFEEVATTATVRAELAAAGIAERPCPTPTGAVALVEGGRPGGTVLVRADIDALPVQEELALPYASRVDGVMHACGHDAHTAILLGAATSLAAHAEELPGRYLLVFQPGEERVSGAQRMLDGGLLDGLDPAPMAAIGLHVTSVLPSGWIATREGHAMAGARGLRIRITGGGGHGALNPRAGNVVLAAARIADRLDRVVEGMATEGTAYVCSPGALHAGTAPNVVPRYAELAATLRWFEKADLTEAMRRLDVLAGEVSAEFEVSVDVVAEFGTIPVRNTGWVTDAVLDAAAGIPGTAARRAPAPVAASDDVSVFLDRIPGCYAMVGAGLADGSSGAHHSPTFAIDEGALRIGAALLATGAVRLAGGVTAGEPHQAWRDAAGGT